MIPPSWLDASSSYRRTPSSPLVYAETPPLCARMEARGDRKFKILTIDGGGIRGILPLKVLAALARMWGRENPLHETFDLVAGTSTGGIIALGLAAPTPQTPEDLLDLYQNHPHRIFIPHPRPFTATAFRVVFGETMARAIGNSPIFSSAAIYDIATERFGGGLLRDVRTNVLIPAVNVTNASRPQLVEFTNRDRSYASLTLSSVACATSAAPTYFPSHFIGTQEYVDGGLGANNPSLLAHLYSLHQGISPDRVCMLSLGTGFTDRGYCSVGRNHNLLYWARNISSTVDCVTSDLADRTLSLHLGADRYVRMSPHLARTIDLADYSADTLAYLSDQGDALVDGAIDRIREIARSLRPDIF